MTSNFGKHLATALRPTRTIACHPRKSLKWAVRRTTRRERKNKVAAAIVSANKKLGAMASSFLFNRHTGREIVLRNRRLRNVAEGSFTGGRERMGHRVQVDLHLFAGNG